MSSEDPTQVFPKALEEIRQRLAELEEKVATRGYDTRPIFEAHDRQIKDLEAQVKELESKSRKRRLADLHTLVGHISPRMVMALFAVIVTNLVKVTRELT